MQFSAADVQKLRGITGAGIMDCKRALTDSGGDVDKAKALINERGLQKAEKKAERGTGAGVLESYVHNERIGVLLDIRSETDFVARSAPFRTLAHDLAMHIAAMGPDTKEELLAQPYFRDPNATVEQHIKSVVAKTGENIQVNRFARYEL